MTATVREGGEGRDATERDSCMFGCTDIRVVGVGYDLVLNCDISSPTVNAKL